MARPARRASSPDDTRERILAAARGLFSARRELAPNDAELARHAGVSRATLHRHFRSRQALLRAIELTPEPGARERAVAAGIELLARDGLAQLSMDELAGRAGVSRANLYRLFPGKAALFKELIRVYSPLEPIGATVAELKDEPPEVVMPAIARAVARHLQGRVGLVRSLFFEMSAPSDEVATARELVIQTALDPLAAYLLTQMEAGRLRRIQPLLAMQAFAGPIIFHLLLQTFAEQLLDVHLPVETSVAELAWIWLRGMRPDQPDREE